MSWLRFDFWSSRSELSSEETTANCIILQVRLNATVTTQEWNKKNQPHHAVWRLWGPYRLHCVHTVVRPAANRAIRKASLDELWSKDAYVRGAKPKQTCRSVVTICSETREVADEYGTSAESWQALHFIVMLAACNMPSTKLRTRHLSETVWRSVDTFTLSWFV